jgi:hypothetical protein
MLRYNRPAMCAWNGKDAESKSTRPPDKTLRVLAVADQVEPQLYNGSVADWLGPIDLIISCGDLPPAYLDFLMSTLNAPLVHVKGNHCHAPHDPITGRCDPAAYQGAYDLNGVVAEYEGLLLAGAEGSPWYNGGPHQYTEQQMTVNLLRLVPGLLRNKVQTGRYLDIMVTHAPPRGIHDNPDMAHRGFASLVPFIERFHPMLLLHGHTHRYEPLQPMRSVQGRTEILNVFGHVLLELARDKGQPGWRLLNPKQGEVNYG